MGKLPLLIDALLVIYEYSEKRRRCYDRKSYLYHVSLLPNAWNAALETQILSCWVSLYSCQMACIPICPAFGEVLIIAIKLNCFEFKVLYRIVHNNRCCIKNTHVGTHWKQAHSANTVPFFLSWIYCTRCLASLLSRLLTLPDRKPIKNMSKVQ